MTKGPGSREFVQDPLKLAGDDERQFYKEKSKPHTHSGNHGNPFLRPDLTRQDEISFKKCLTWT